MTQLHLYDVIVRPIVTEESQIMAERGQYVFEVTLDANKRQIKEAIQAIFDKKVLKINTMIMPAKRGMRGRNEYWRSKQWKKAIVTLVAGETIDLFNV
ncbi:MAG: 50S ribosomal protein L23 [Anaerolineae bacterium]|nr:50S ribosomal protein L23 [Anaerolineae bacterium]